MEDGNNGKRRQHFSPAWFV